MLTTVMEVISINDFDSNALVKMDAHLKQSLKEAINFYNKYRMDDTEKITIHSVMNKAAIEFVAKYHKDIREQKDMLKNVKAKY